MITGAIGQIVHRRLDRHRRASRPSCSRSPAPLSASRSSGPSACARSAPPASNRPSPSGARRRARTASRRVDRTSGRYGPWGQRGLKPIAGKRLAPACQRAGAKDASGGAASLASWLQLPPKPPGADYREARALMDGLGPGRAGRGHARAPRAIARSPRRRGRSSRPPTTTTRSRSTAMGEVVRADPGRDRGRAGGSPSTATTTSTGSLRPRSWCARCASSARDCDWLIPGRLDRRLRADRGERRAARRARHRAADHRRLRDRLGRRGRGGAGGGDRGDRHRPPRARRRASRLPDPPPGRLGLPVRASSAPTGVAYKLAVALRGTRGGRG